MLASSSLDYHNQSNEKKTSNLYDHVVHGTIVLIMVNDRVDHGKRLCRSM